MPWLASGYPVSSTPTSQGAQFTSWAWLARLQQQGIRISMDGRGRALDNGFVEHLWRTVKYEDVYRRDYQTVPELKAGLDRSFRFDNKERPHSALDHQTPEEVHWPTCRKSDPGGALKPFISHALTVANDRAPPQYLLAGCRVRVGQPQGVFQVVGRMVCPRPLAGQVLPESAVDVLDGLALPGGIRIAKIGGQMAAPATGSWLTSSLP